MIARTMLLLAPPAAVRRRIFGALFALLFCSAVLFPVVNHFSAAGSSHSSQTVSQSQSTVEDAVANTVTGSSASSSLLHCESCGAEEATLVSCILVLSLVVLTANFKKFCSPLTRILKEISLQKVKLVTTYYSSLPTPRPCLISLCVARN